MSWVTLFRNWLSGFSAAPAPPRAFANPLDYVLDASLSGQAVLPAALQARYPGLSDAQAAAVEQQLAQLQKLTMDLGSLVNRQELDQNTASERLSQTYPQLDRRNLGRLLWQAFVATR